MLTDQVSIAAVVVTYNRKNLLRECLQALLTQSRPLDEIMVIDNASGDGTVAMLAADFPRVTMLTLPENVGGTGGFVRGMQLANAKGHHWVWLMDDDLIPQVDALEQLLRVISKTNQSTKMLIGGLPQDKSGRLAWRLKLGHKWVSHACSLPLNADDKIEVNSLPFLGLLVPAIAIAEIGFPRTDFFVYLDDVEYCYRARRNGYKIFCVPHSRLFHPLPERQALPLLGRIVVVERFPAWKAYYDVRNRILLGLEYERFRFWYRFLPVILLRILLSLIWYRENRLKKMQACLLGLWDGLRRQTGRRVAP